jgi:hypothetical protein
MVLTDEKTTCDPSCTDLEYQGVLLTREPRQTALSIRARMIDSKPIHIASVGDTPIMSSDNIMETMNMTG